MRTYQKRVTKPRKLFAVRLEPGLLYHLQDVAKARNISVGALLAEAAATVTQQGARNAKAS